MLHPPLILKYEMDIILVDKHGASWDQRLDGAIYRLLTTIAITRWKENIENLNMSKMGMYYNTVL